MPRKNYNTPSNDTCNPSIFNACHSPNCCVMNVLTGQLLSLLGPLATVLDKIDYLNHRKLTSKSKKVGCQYKINQNLPIYKLQTSSFEPAEQNLYVSWEVLSVQILTWIFMFYSVKNLFNDKFCFLKKFCNQYSINIYIFFHKQTNNNS